MSELPIIFTSESVRAIEILAKTQTRRVVACPRWAEPKTLEVDPDDPHKLLVVCRQSGCLAEVKPRYQVGDRLWVKEPHWRFTGCGQPGPEFIRSPDGDRYKARAWLDAIDGDDLSSVVKVSPLYMPRWAARHLIDVLDVRVERLQDISEKDAVAEGVESHIDDGATYYGLFGNGHASAVHEFHRVWDRINGKRAPWKSNPRVFVYEFRKVD